jgi:chromosome segregation ATPase
MVKKISEKNTKAEILTAFNELLKEKKALESQMQVSESRLNGKSVASGVMTTQVEQQKMDGILELLNRVQLSFGGAISDLSEKLTLEAFKLQEVRQSVASEVQQLEALHGLQVTEGSLDALIQQYGESYKAFNAELNQRREVVEQESTQGKKVWAKEQEEHRRAIKERNETLNKTRQRDVKEYTYDLTLQRKLARDEYEQERKALYQELEESQQAQEKQWAEREKAIAEREKQFEDLRVKVEAFPKDLEAGIKRAKEEGKGIAHHQAKVKADLFAKDVEGSKRFYELRVQSLQESIQNQESRIQNLSKQLDSALKQVQDLAVKAIEGASNVNSFQAVKEIAIEQAKTQMKNK